jgi:hypothetical protein
MLHYSITPASFALTLVAPTLGHNRLGILHKKSRRLFRLRPVKTRILGQLPQADSSLKKPKKKQKPKQ